jgi:GT2 family glycosyltransferase
MQQVSILIPHYKTLELTKLCLRLIRTYTDLSRVKTIVIDNNSQDESSQYLETVNWITLLKRDQTGEGGPTAHARALDLGMGQVDTPYVLSIHTDTLVSHAGWLDYLIKKINARPNIAGIGSWKLEHKSAFARLLKK